MTSPLTRPELIVRLKSAEDQAAWAEFLLSYDAFLDHLIRRHGVPESHSADAKQNVLLAVAKGVARFENDGKPASFRRWISTVGRNAAIKYMVAQRRHPAPCGGTDAMQGMGDIADEADHHQRHIDHELIVWAAHHVRSQFASSSWKAFWETMVEGRDVESVAAELSITPGSIYMSRGRILRRIRETIGELSR